MRVVGGIGKVLCFEAHGGVFGEWRAGMVVGGAIQVVATVELNGWLGCEDLEEATGSRIEKFGGRFEVR